MPRSTLRARDRDFRGRWHRLGRSAGSSGGNDAPTTWTRSWPRSCSPTSSIRRAERRARRPRCGAVRRRHDEIARTELERHRGREGQDPGLRSRDGSKGRRGRRPSRWGDRRRRSQPRYRDPCRLHTGEVELEGDDIAGIAVAIGAPGRRLGGPLKRCWCPEPSKTSPPGAASCSSMRVSTTSRVSPTAGSSTA